MKIRRKRFSLIIIAIILITILFHKFYELFNSSIKTSNENICEISPEMRSKMSETLSQTIEALTTLDLTYFLCYDSLWGALRIKGPLKWHQIIDLCLLNEEVSHLDEAFLIRTFQRKGLKISYQSSDGIYLVKQSDQSKPLVNLYLFEEDLNQNHYRRVGWKNRLVPPDSCDQIHCFPPRLISKPLPNEMFMNFEISVPREQIEIQKYLFPENWWKDTEPEHCKNEV